MVWVIEREKKSFFLYPLDSWKPWNIKNKKWLWMKMNELWNELLLSHTHTHNKQSALGLVLILVVVTVSFLFFMLSVIFHCFFSYCIFNHYHLKNWLQINRLLTNETIGIIIDNLKKKFIKFTQTHTYVINMNRCKYTKKDIKSQNVLDNKMLSVSCCQKKWMKK